MKGYEFDQNCKFIQMEWIRLINICNDSKIRADAEVFGLFRDLIPPEAFQEGGSNER